MNWQPIIKYIFNSRFGFIFKKLILWPFHIGGNLHLRLIHGNEIVKLLNKVRKETDILHTNHAAFNVYSFAIYCNELSGDFAEVGVYKGGTAKLMCEVKGGKPLHLFDTFDGLPNTKNKNDTYLEIGQLKSSFVKVKKLLKDYDNVNFYVGNFPETAFLIKEKKFAYVHLDADFYQSTKDGLEFFYPRMTSGGLILIHDYLQLPGVKKAVDDFIKPIVLSTGQALIIKN